MHFIKNSDGVVLGQPQQQQQRLNIQGDLWVGNITGETPRRTKVSVVVSWCDERLQFLKDFVDGLPIRSIFIYSKCTSRGLIPSRLQELGDVHELVLDNVGRNDHTYAHHMANMTTFSHDEVVLFIKASTHNQIRIRSAQEMVRIASTRLGFACLSGPIPCYSVWHKTAFILAHFNLQKYRGPSTGFRSPYQNPRMSSWAKDIGLTLPKVVMPVCYGGAFAVLASQIGVNKHVWPALEQSLSRGDNIEEGHFAERSWAALLMAPIAQQEALELLEISEATCYRPGSYVGTLWSRSFCKEPPKKTSCMAVARDGQFRPSPSCHSAQGFEVRCK